MFVREKQIGPYRYLYLVESVREGGRTKQRIIKNLGRKESVDANGDLDRLARSAARMAQRSMVLSLLDQGSVPALATHRIGPPLAFERLWLPPNPPSCSAKPILARCKRLRIRSFSDRGVEDRSQQHRARQSTRLPLPYFSDTTSS